MRALVAGIVLSALMALPAQAAGRIRAVLVGINDYAHVSDLDGAVADARDLAGALLRRGATVALLLDRQATRENVVRALTDAIERSEPGDAVVFAFAGHGVQMAEALAGDEADGRDEVFLFAGFTPKGEMAGERLRDNDISELIAKVPDGVGILIIADSCHSGTMTRAPLPLGRIGRVRSEEVGPISADPLPPPPPETYQQDETVGRNTVFIAGALDGQVLPEVYIDGQARGALSFVVARAFEGRAHGGDDWTNLADLRAYVLASVRAFSADRQTPSVVFAETATRSAEDPQADLQWLFNPGSGAAEKAPELATGVAADAEGGRIVIGPGGDGAPAPALALAPNPVVFDMAPGLGTGDVPSGVNLVWDPDGPALIDRRTGDLVARPMTEEGRAAAILAWRAARALRRWVTDRPAELRLTEGDDRHLVGSAISVTVRPPEAAPDLRYLTLVNLAGTGEVQYVFPSEAFERRDGDLISPDAPFTSGKIPVTEPVGTDTLLAIFSAERPVALREALRGLNGQIAPEALLEVLETHVGPPAQERVALQRIFTGLAE